MLFSTSPLKLHRGHQKSDEDKWEWMYRHLNIRSILVEIQMGGCIDTQLNIGLVVVEICMRLGV